MKTAEEWADIIAAYQTRGALAHIVDEIRREQHEATMGECMPMYDITFESTQEDK